MAFPTAGSFCYALSSHNSASNLFKDGATPKVPPQELRGAWHTKLRVFDHPVVPVFLSRAEQVWSVVSQQNLTLLQPVRKFFCNRSTLLTGALRKFKVCKESWFTVCWCSVTSLTTSGGIFGVVVVADTYSVITCGLMWEGWLPGTTGLLQ